MGEDLLQVSVAVTEPDGQVSTWTYGRSDYQGSRLVVECDAVARSRTPIRLPKGDAGRVEGGIEVLVCRKSAPIGSEAVGMAEKMAGKVTDLTAWPRRWFP